MRRCAAFTLVELSVVMLLTAIVTTIAFLTLSILQKSLTKFKADSDAMIEIELLNRLLVQDFMEARDVCYQAEGIRVNAKSGPVEYLFYPEEVLRSKAGLSDTFHLSASLLASKFRGVEISVPSHLIDDFSFTVLHKEESFPMNFHKLYGADRLMLIESGNSN